MAEHYDLMVIGGGSGGLSVAERATGYGARCALIEAGRLGGTCVNVGCVPKKVMWYAAHLAHTLDDAAGYGFRLDYFGFSVATVLFSRPRTVFTIHPRAVWGCHPAASQIWTSVAPSGRVSRPSSTSCFVPGRETGAFAGA